MGMSGKQQMPPLARSFDLARASIDEEARTVEIDFSSESAVERWFGSEILDHSPQSVRLGRMNNGAPLLLDHDSGKQIGVVESARIEGGKGRALVRFSRSDRGEEVFRDVVDGIRSKVSVGYRIHKLRMVEADKTTKKETYRAEDWEPFEVSIVSIPADDSVGVRDLFGARAAQLSTTITMEHPNETQEEIRDLAQQAPETKPVESAPEGARSAETNKPTEADKAIEQARIDARAAEIAAAEIDRRAEIEALAREFSIPADKVKDAVKRKLSVEDFKSVVFEQLRSGSVPFTVPKPTADIPNAEKGSRAHLESAWAESAKNALGARGSALQIPSRIEVISESRNYIGGAGNLTLHRSMTGSLTLLDVAKSDAGIGYPVIDEAVQMIPEIGIFPVDTINGDTISLSVRTTKGSAAFRNANEGYAPTVAEFESRIFQTAIIEKLIQVDIQGVLNASKDPGRFLVNQTVAQTKDVLEHVAFQQWYGGTAMSSDTKAPPGILAQSNSAATHVVDATGSTAKTSVWVLELGQYSLDHVYGNGSTFTFGDQWEEDWGTDGAGGQLRVLKNYISGRVAPRLANKNAAVRIKNLGTDSNKGLTDSLLAQAFRKARELGMRPNAIFATPRSVEQLQISRTTYSPIGAPAPMPEEYMGVPIYQTINLSSAETV